MLAATPALGAAAPDVTTLIVGFPPGGPIDKMARALEEPLQEALGNIVIIENRTGASGRIAVDAVVSATPAGRTLLLTPGAMITLHPHLYRELRYDPLKQLIPVALLGTTDLAIVVESSHPARDVNELMRWFKEHPQSSSCGTPGAGSVSHFVMLETGRKAGVDVIFVHYRGALQQIEALLEGSLKAAVVVPWVAVPYFQSGKLKALATTGAVRSPPLRDTPTLREFGIDVTAREWAGLFAQAGTSPEIVNRVAAASVAALAKPAVESEFAKYGMDVGGTVTTEFATMVKADYDRWGRIVKVSGVKAES